MKTVTEVIGVSRSNLIERMRERAKKRIGRPPLPDDNLVAEIKAVIAELPTYGYRRNHAILKRQALAAGLKPPNHKRVYRVMKVHDLLRSENCQNHQLQRRKEFPLKSRAALWMAHNKARSRNWSPATCRQVFDSE
jgi:putative transposase